MAIFIVEIEMQICKITFVMEETADSIMSIFNLCDQMTKYFFSMLVKIIS